MNKTRVIIEAGSPVTSGGAVRAWALIFTALITLITLSGCGGDANTLAKVLKEGFITFGVQPDSSPMAFLNDSGEKEGLSVDLAKEIASRLNIDAKFKFVDPDEAVNALNNGTIDMYINLPSPGQKIMAKVETVSTGLEHRHIVVVLSNSSIYKLSDLTGKKACAVSGSDAAGVLDMASVLKSDLAEVYYANNNDELIQRLESGGSQLAIIDELSFKYSTRGRDQSKYRILGEEIAASEYLMTMRLRDYALAERVGIILDAMREDGKYDGIKNQWLS